MKISSEEGRQQTLADRIAPRESPRARHIRPGERELRLTLDHARVASCGPVWAVPARRAGRKAVLRLLRAQ
jgi:hypothetical protein